MCETEDKKIRLHNRYMKSYRKNTGAIFFSFTLTFLLLTAILILLHTNNRIAAIQDQAVFSPADCYLTGLEEEQIVVLKQDKEIANLALEQEGRFTYKRHNQTLFLTKGDDAMITMMSHLADGRMPEREGEVAAEKWTLLNLGVEPILGRVFTAENFVTGEQEEFVLVGILTDMSANKKYGTLFLYTAPDESATSYIAYLELQDGVTYETKLESLKLELGIQEEQIHVSPVREDFNALYRTDAAVAGLILLICMVIFYGIYRIASVTRVKQYGILRAIGMKNKQLKRMIVLELYQIYWVSVPVGVGFGMLLALFIIDISRDNDMEIYLFNEKVMFRPVIPAVPILICIVLTAVLIGIIGYLIGRKMVRATITETIAEVPFSGGGRRRGLGLGKSDSKLGTLFSLGKLYLFRDLKTSSFVVLTISLGVTLFTGLAYKAETLRTYREDTKEIWYLNGDYEMSMLGFDQADQGVSRQSAQKIQDLEEIVSVKTASGLPVRVIDEDQIERNDNYYEELNQNLEEYYGYRNDGFDGTNQVYKSLLFGYNRNALIELKKYIIEGDFDPDHLEEDEIILSVLQMKDPDEENALPGGYKEGTPLMAYHVGDEISVKYRTDGKTGSLEYENFSDTDAKYSYKTYKIAAIVSFQYMYNCNRTVYPILITEDRHIQAIAPDSGIQCMYMDAADGMSVQQMNDLELKLIQISNQNENVSTRSLIEEIEKNEMFYHKQMIYIYGISVVAFVLALINMINNLRYRMQTRTREVSMLRAIGMSVAMTKKMMLFENTVLGLVGIAAAFVISHPILKGLYRLSEMEVYGHRFHYAFGAFAAVSAAALAICMALSFWILKSWKTKQIVKEIGNVE